jgi:dehydrogenase/reductase SDR family protein 7B
LSDLNTLPDRARQAVAIFGHIDILVNNGGISSRSDVLSMDAEVFKRIMVVNYLGNMVLTKGEFLKQSKIFHFVDICSNY